MRQCTASSSAPHTAFPLPLDLLRPLAAQALNALHSTPSQGPQAHFSQEPPPHSPGHIPGHKVFTHLSQLPAASLPYGFTHFQAPPSAEEGSLSPSQGLTQLAAAAAADRPSQHTQHTQHGSATPSPGLSQLAAAAADRWGPLPTAAQHAQHTQHEAAALHSPIAAWHAAHHSITVSLAPLLLASTHPSHLQQGPFRQPPPAALHLSHPITGIQPTGLSCLLALPSLYRPHADPLLEALTVPCSTPPPHHPPQAAAPDAPSPSFQALAYSPAASPTLLPQHTPQSQGAFASGPAHPPHAQAPSARLSQPAAAGDTAHLAAQQAGHQLVTGPRQDASGHTPQQPGQGVGGLFGAIAHGLEAKGSQWHTPGAGQGAGGAASGLPTSQGPVATSGSHLACLLSAADGAQAVAVASVSGFWHAEWGPNLGCKV